MEVGGKTASKERKSKCEGSQDWPPTICGILMAIFLQRLWTRLTIRDGLVGVVVAQKTCCGLLRQFVVFEWSSLSTSFGLA